MTKFSKPIQETNYHIGILYELSLQSNYRLTDAVTNLKNSVGYMSSTENTLRYLIHKQNVMDSLCAKTAIL